jgi:hypothetical protein
MNFSGGLQRMANDIEAIAKEVAELRQLIEAINKFDPKSLVRREKLGDFAFDEAVTPALALIGLFKQIPLDALGEFPAQQRSEILRAATAANSCFEGILKFDLTAGDTATQREQLILELVATYQPSFTTLHPFISFAVARTVDFSALETKAREAIREYPELCVSCLAHTGFRYGHALKRSSNMIANWFLAANHSRTFLPPFSKLRIAR